MSGNVDVRVGKKGTGMGRIRVRRSHIFGGNVTGLVSLAFAALKFVPIHIDEPFPYVVDELEYVGISDYLPRIRPGSIVPLYTMEISVSGDDGTIDVTLRDEAGAVLSVTAGIYRYVHTWRMEMPK